MRTIRLTRRFVLSCQPVICTVGLFLALLVVAGLRGARAEEAATVADSTSPEFERYVHDVKPLLVTYCYECHGNGASEGNRAFDALEANGQLLNDPHVWSAMLKNVRAGVMPPEGSERLSTEDLKRISEWVKRDVFKIDPANPDPGRVVLRRLNRVEYQNTIRDLLDYDYDVELNFPPDDTGYGFDTIGEVLTVSPMLTEKYLAAAESIIDAVAPKVSRQPASTEFEGRDFVEASSADEVVVVVEPPVGGGRGGRGGRGGGRFSGQEVNFDREADLGTTFTAETDGQYKVDLEIRIDGQFEYNPLRTHLRFLIDGVEHVNRVFVYEDGASYFYTIEQDFAAGEHDLRFRFTPLPPAEGSPEGRPDRMVRVRIRTVTVAGPLAREHWVKPQNFDRLYTREFPPESDDERIAYAREVLSKFATRAFRQPVDEASADALTQIAAGEWRKPGKTFEEGVARAMVAVLASPRFLYRVEQSLPKTDGETYALLDEYALASRLSYFLWSTMPDEELLQLADEGKLREQLDAQVDRMLASPRSQAFVENFVGQWLRSRDVAHVRIDANAVAFADLSPAEAAAQAQQTGGRGRGNRGRGNRAGANANALNRANRPNAPGAANEANPAAAADGANPAAADAAADDAAAANAETREAAVNADQATPAERQGNQEADAAAIAPERARQILVEQANLPAANEAPAAAPEVANANPAAPAADANRGRRGRGQRGVQANRGRGGRGRADFDAQLRRAMQQETEMQFAYIMRENRSLLELLDADYAFLNERLAQHYGIEGVTGNEMQLVKLDADSPRGGVLTQGTLLTITSNPDRTSPVKRGFYILDNILGTPPPPPPPDIPDLEASVDKLKGKNPTLREVLEVHRDSPLCSACHSRMDPLGLALENFNAMGVWRTSEKGLPINATGQLVSGEEFDNIKTLKTILKETKKRDFYQCLTEKLMTYALGRGVEYTDAYNVDLIVDELDREGGNSAVLLKGIIHSPQFQRRRDAEPQTVATNGQQE